MIRLCLRAFGAEKRFAAALVLANASLTIARFGEPVLFGRNIDRVKGGNSDEIGVLPPLVGWGTLGLLDIVCAVAPAFAAARPRAASIEASPSRRCR